MRTTASSSQIHGELLRQVCSKRSSAEIEVEALDGSTQRGRMRLLRSDDHAVYIDRPSCHGMPLELTSDMAISVHFIVDGERYSFRAEIIEECLVPLGRDQTIPGFSIALPEHVSRDERRLDFRASLGRSIEIVSRVRPDQGPQEGSFSARIMNISAGGMAVVAVELGGLEIRKGGTYWVEFTLPEVNRTFAFKTELRHLRDLSGAGYIMGLKFLPETNAAEMRHAVRQISQFVAKQLNRNRSRTAAS